ncbi:hypothetical protein Tco_0710703 [Tanacetum coccineum]
MVILWVIPPPLFYGILWVHPSSLRDAFGFIPVLRYGMASWVICPPFMRCFRYPVLRNRMLWFMPSSVSGCFRLCRPPLHMMLWVYVANFPRLREYDLGYAVLRYRQDASKISKNGIEVDKPKDDVIAKLPHPTTVKGVRSFLGHADFYRRFIKDFSKISRLMTHLLEKNTPFIFSNECIQAFEMLKKKLTEAPILIAPGTDIQEKDKKKAKNKQNRARNGKDQVKSKS